MLETFETLDRAAIGKRITDGRKHIKMRREKLAEKLDVSVQFIADVEYGKKGMSMKTLDVYKRQIQDFADGPYAAAACHDIRIGALGCVSIMPEAGHRLVMS